MPEADADALRGGAPDAYGRPAERQVSPGGMPCRHCLDKIEAQEEMLVLAYRPFPRLQPYAETGPIFLHARSCRGYGASHVLPPMLDSPDYIVRGYGADDRIVYGTGAVTPTAEIVERAAALLLRPEIAYLHVRSARNNCYQCRIERS
ncbi:DUF1203 domain-containing protein [Rhizobium sp. SSA_523]|uniref:DUF1203 domain-containing protein n=1 Tax=Rhizobium sp. SSA_523 TaxID=2952477 RepID=UPI002090241F|nr:DUF1203 domain-containing protein [Rhizobium sp. SSA_523]MCO5734018.1 DUF1203 domain-containing protein [Rhizobium sp. SSA_523]WKC24660.1 DUF1203 domain-containing protein [Rhizobium sp. SSA_523]